MNVDAVEAKAGAQLEAEMNVRMDVLLALVNAVEMEVVPLQVLPLQHQAVSMNVDAVEDKAGARLEAEINVRMDARLAPVNAVEIEKVEILDLLHQPLLVHGKVTVNALERN